MSNPETGRLETIQLKEEDLHTSFLGIAIMPDAKDHFWSALIKLTLALIGALVFFLLILVLPFVQNVPDETKAAAETILHYVFSLVWLLGFGFVVSKAAVFLLQDKDARRFQTTNWSTLFIHL